MSDREPGAKIDFAPLYPIHMVDATAFPRWSTNFLGAQGVCLMGERCV